MSSAFTDGVTEVPLRICVIRRNIWKFSITGCVLPSRRTGALLGSCVLTLLYLRNQAVHFGKEKSKAIIHSQWPIHSLYCETTYGGSCNSLDTTSSAVALIADRTAYNVLHTGIAVVVGQLEYLLIYSLKLKSAFDASQCFSRSLRFVAKRYILQRKCPNK